MNIDIKKIFNSKLTKEEEIIFLYKKYQLEQDKLKKLKILKQIEKLKVSDKNE